MISRSSYDLRESNSSTQARTYVYRIYAKSNGTGQRVRGSEISYDIERWTLHNSCLSCIKVTVGLPYMCRRFMNCVYCNILLKVQMQLRVQHGEKITTQQAQNYDTNTNITRQKDSSPHKKIHPNSLHRAYNLHIYRVYSINLQIRFSRERRL